MEIGIIIRTFLGDEPSITKTIDVMGEENHVQKLIPDGRNYVFDNRDRSYVTV